MSTQTLSKKMPQLVLSATILATVTLIGASGPSLSAPLHPVAPLSIQGNIQGVIQGNDAAAVFIPVRAAARGGRAAGSDRVAGPSSPAEPPLPDPAVARPRAARPWSDHAAMSPFATPPLWRGGRGASGGHVLVLHRSVPHPGLLGLLSAIAAHHVKGYHDVARRERTERTPAG